MLRIVLSKSALPSLAKLAPDVHAAALDALRRIPAAFGHPHAHVGLGIRQLRPDIYEARIGLQLRAVFVRDAQELVVMAVGNHDEIQRYLKDRA